MKIFTSLLSFMIIICLSLAIQLPSNVIVENVEASFNVPLEEEVKHETKVFASLENVEYLEIPTFYNLIIQNITYVPLEVITPPPDKFEV